MTPQRLFSKLLLVFSLLAAVSTLASPENADQSDEDYVQILEQEFNSYDENQDGLMDAKEIRARHSDVAMGDFEAFFEAADVDHSGTLDFNEYLEYFITENH